ncbi:hypothetical protein HanXRQr2_Chr16g0735501 [Helianthus annuus]|uniref:Uncharacterized protein n=1 Tax=Helianthus annuus TaxID=4232 RepID=A0A251SGA7_HELAN|nr:hypothetical protein HanXRQr2_Chr16g0735501 [Helianthus annuus]
MKCREEKPFVLRPNVSCLLQLSHNVPQLAKIWRSFTVLPLCVFGAVERGDQRIGYRETKEK